jgi:hypothetical protein
MSQDTARPTVDIDYWRQHVEKALADQLAKAGIAHQSAIGTGPNEVHTAFRIDEAALCDNHADTRYVAPAMQELMAGIQKANIKRVAVLLDVQDVAGCPGIAIRLFPQG